MEIWSFAASGKILQPLAAGLRGFLNGGFRAYVVAGSTEGGDYRGGTGVAQTVGPNLYAEATFDLSWTVTMPSDIRFTRTQLGFVWTADSETRPAETER